MRTAEIDYDIPASIMGDPNTSLSVNWEIQFEPDGAGPDACILIKARALTVQAMVGGMPFGESRDVSSYCSGVLRHWLDLRKLDLTFESIGYTEAEAKREYLEEEEDREEESRQIGRPI